MNRKKRRLRRALLLLLLTLLLTLAALIVFRYSPYVREITKNQMVNAASSALYHAVTEQLFSGTADYSRLVIFEKDASGAITALHTDAAQVGRIKAEVFALLDESLLQTQVQTLGIPIGTLLLPDFFAGCGAKLPVRVMSLTTTDADFYTEISEAGINQTLMTTSLTFSVDIVVLSAIGIQTLSVPTTVLLSQTVLLGRVPDTFIQHGSITGGN